MGRPCSEAPLPTCLLARRIWQIVSSMRTTETSPPTRGGMSGPLSLQPRLRLVYSARSGLVENGLYALTVGANIIGRERGDWSGIALADDELVSRRHAFIYISETNFSASIEDRSKNGTFLNGHRLTGPAVLQEGDVLRTGDSWFVFRYEPHPSQQPTSAIAPTGVSELVGISPAMRQLREDILEIAQTQSPVLILGETGTGKELVARAIHRLSDRKGEFQPVNCSAVPESLAESLFFGTVSGAFTGATSRSGYFRSANGGSLFLDEIGDLSLALQPKLLRAIDLHEIIPVGETRPVRCDVRVICATLRDLWTAVSRGEFRQDLYARLSFELIQIAPLRARREDILVLLRHYYRQSQAELPKLPEDLVDTLLLHPWPQNTREVQQVALHLQNQRPYDALFERLRKNATLGPQSSPQATALPSTLPPAPIPARLRPGTAPTSSRHQLTALLRKHKGVVQRVARELGCSRRHIGRLLDEHKLDPSQFRRRSEDQH